jgi:hypothetical protein
VCLGTLVRDDDEKRLSYEGSNLGARTSLPDDDEKTPRSSSLMVQITMPAPRYPTTTLRRTGLCEVPQRIAYEPRIGNLFALRPRVDVSANIE